MRAMLTVVTLMGLFISTGCSSPRDDVEQVASASPPPSLADWKIRTIGKVEGVGSLTDIAMVPESNAGGLMFDVVGPFGWARLVLDDGDQIRVLRTFEFSNAHRGHLYRISYPRGRTTPMFIKMPTPGSSHVFARASNGEITWELRRDRTGFSDRAGLVDFDGDGEQELFYYTRREGLTFYSLDGDVLAERPWPETPAIDRWIVTDLDADDCEELVFVDSGGVCIRSGPLGVDFARYPQPVRGYINGLHQLRSNGRTGRIEISIQQQGVLGTPAPRATYVLTVDAETWEGTYSRSDEIETFRQLEGVPIIATDDATQVSIRATTSGSRDLRVSVHGINGERHFEGEIARDGAEGSGKGGAFVLADARHRFGRVLIAWSSSLYLIEPEPRHRHDRKILISP